MKKDETKTKEQLKKKTRDLEVMAAVCKVNPEEALEDIAVSVETTNNKFAESLRPQDETKDPYLGWWAIFLEEWSYKCAARWLGKYRDSKDYERMQNLWFGFEILWVIGCNMVRITRLNELGEGISAVIVRESPSKTDIEKIWRWHDESTNQLDEPVSKMVDLFKEKQRQAITQILKELREYDEASLLGKLKRLISE